MIDEENPQHLATCNDGVFPIRDGSVVIPARLPYGGLHIALSELRDQLRRDR